MASLSIIVPVLDEEARIGAALAALAPLRARGAEVIVADGGSRDRTVAIARPLADRVIDAPRGRGAQMNAGAAAASGDVLLFLHADTRAAAGGRRPGAGRPCATRRGNGAASTCGSRAAARSSP